MVKIWLEGENSGDEIPFLELLFSFYIYNIEVKKRVKGRK